MRLSCALPILASVVLATAGCGPTPSTTPATSPTPSTTPLPPSVKSPGTPSALATRLEATKSLMNIDQREISFAQLAIDAAEAGEVQIMNNCLTSLANINLREQTTVKAVSKLGKAGKTDEALTLAKTIMNINTRERVIGKIAKGDYSE